MRLAGLTVGIIALKPDEADPEVILGVFDPELQEPVSRRLRPGESMTVGGRTLRVVAVRPNPNGSVTLAADEPDAADEPR